MRDCKNWTYWLSGGGGALLPPPPSKYTCARVLISYTSTRKTLFSGTVPSHTSICGQLSVRVSSMARDPVMLVNNHLVISSRHGAWGRCLISSHNFCVLC